MGKNKQNKATQNARKRVLSGIRASHSSLHLGNLLGAIYGMKELQDNPNYETFYMVADLHRITTPFKPEELRKNRLAVAMDYLAAGIDPEKNVLFLQSDVPEHAEFAYYLSSLVTILRLLKAPAFKDKEKEYHKDSLENISSAMLNYPVLMASDILLYKAELVPIAGDQIPHLEVTREIARKMNREYGLDLPEPKQFTVYDRDMMVPSILGDGGKMSKSKEGSAIFLNDSKKTIENKIAKMPTDSGKGKKAPVPGDKAYPFFQMVKIILGEGKRKELEKQYVTSGVSYSDVKQELSDAIYKKLKPIQKKRKELEKNPKKVEGILKKGARKARQVASETLEEVREAMGLPKL